VTQSVIFGAIETPWYVSLILSWLPLFLFLASALWVGRRIARELATRDGKSIAQLMDQYGRELKTWKNANSNTQTA
jgi:hypothetical protein